REAADRKEDEFTCQRETRQHASDACAFLQSQIHLVPPCTSWRALVSSRISQLHGRTCLVLRLSLQLSLQLSLRRTLKSPRPRSGHLSCSRLFPHASCATCHIEGFFSARPRCHDTCLHPLSSPWYGRSGGPTAPWGRDRLRQHPPRSLRLARRGLASLCARVV